MVKYFKNLIRWRYLCTAIFATTLIFLGFSVTTKEYWILAVLWAVSMAISREEPN